MRSKIVALGLLACSLCPTASSATVLNWAISVENFSAGDQTFSFFFVQPVPVFGQVDTRLSFGMAMGDGARDGASANLAAGAPALVQGRLVQGATTSDVAAAGAAQSFAGEGGTAGQVNLSLFGVTNFAAAPQTFNVLFGNPVAITGRTLLQSTFAGAFADGEVPDGGSIDASPNPDVMQTRLSSGGTAVATLDLGTSTAFAADAGVLVPENAGDLDVDCGAGCDLLQDQAGFTVSPDDVATILMRSEIGGSALVGPVAWTATGFDDATFNCGAIGCDQMSVVISFVLSPGDGVVMAGRFDVEVTDVPEPATLAVLGLALAGLGFARRRRAA